MKQFFSLFLLFGLLFQPLYAGGGTVVSGGGGVPSINGITTATTIAGTGSIVVTPNSPTAGTITISSSGGGSFTPPYTPGADGTILFNNLNSNAIISDDVVGNPLLQGYSAGGTVTGDSLGFNSSGVLTHNTYAVNAAGGLVATASDGSIAILGSTDSSYYSVAIGNGSSSSGGGVAIGLNASGGGGVTIGNGAASPGSGVTIGWGASSQSSGVTIGNGATMDNNNGVAIGVGASSSNGGVAIGGLTTASGGGANFVTGSYAGGGLAIHAIEIADTYGNITAPAIKLSGQLTDGTYALSATLGGSITILNGVITAITESS